MFQLLDEMHKYLVLDCVVWPAVVAHQGRPSLEYLSNLALLCFVTVSNGLYNNVDQLGPALGTALVHPYF